jgi:hypothetical protein
LLGDVNFICDGCVGLAAQEIGVEKTISREARVQILRDAIENDLEITLDALKQWCAEKARWGTDLDTRLRLAIKPRGAACRNQVPRNAQALVLRQGHRQVVKDRH